MIKKRSEEKFYLLLIFLLASNENLASVKYFVCEYDHQFSFPFLCTHDFHNAHKDAHRVSRKDIKVYDNQFYNLIFSERTDNYLTYIFFCLLENILSECSGVYFRKSVNGHFGFFYGTEIGFFSKSRRRIFTNKYFTISFLKELRFNVISALIYITKTIIYVGDGERFRYWKGMDKYIKYLSACITGINGFHIIHVNFLKTITFNFINILKTAALILSYLPWRGYNSFLYDEMCDLNNSPYVKPYYYIQIRREFLLNVDELAAGQGRITLYGYRVFNWLFHIDEKSIKPASVKAISSEDNFDYGKIYVGSNDFSRYIYWCDRGDYRRDCELYKYVQEIKSVRSWNLIANIFNYIWYILSPSISFDLTTIF